jgi:hypothetical protein
MTLTKLTLKLFKPTAEKQNYLKHKNQPKSLTFRIL